MPRARVLTPPGQGGIAVVVVSGPGAPALLDRVFAGTHRPAGRLALGRIAHGTIRRNGAVLDEVIVARVDTAGEPRFEVNCHGGMAAVNAVLDCLRGAGARVVEDGPAAADRPPAPPLSDRAIRAAALKALPRVPTRLGAVMLLHQADGALRRAVETALQALDRGDAAPLCALRNTRELGIALLHPPRVALLGPPNVGKSTLLNALLERERVIVHEEPGTTRDTVTERVSLQGVPFDLTDAAGIRAAGDEVERGAVRRALSLARHCEVALVLFDVREGTWPDAAAVPAFAPGTRVLFVGNKADLLTGPAPPLRLRTCGPTCEPVRISARTRANLVALEDALLAPYRPLIDPCRRGAAVVFFPEAAEALDAAHRAHADGGPAAAACALRRSGA